MANARSASNGDATSRDDLGRLIGDHAKPRTAPSVRVTGNGSPQVIVAGGDIHFHETAGRPRARRLRDEWRQSLKRVIWERAHELQLMAHQVAELAQMQCAKILVDDSLEALDDRELGKLYAALADMKRPALE